MAAGDAGKPGCLCRAVGHRRAGTGGLSGDRGADPHQYSGCDQLRAIIEIAHQDVRTGATRDIQRVFVTHGLKRPLVHYAATVDEALTNMRDGAAKGQEAA